MCMIQKVLGSVLVVLGSSGCGWYLAYAARQRIEILQELLQAIFILYGDIEYAAGDMSENMEGIARRTDVFSVFFKKIAGRLHDKKGQSLYNIWKEEMQGIPYRTRLRREDIAFLEELGKNLGNLDRKTQLHTLQMMEGRLEKSILAAREEYADKAKLFRVVGITVGVFTTVLLF